MESAYPIPRKGKKQKSLKESLAVPYASWIGVKANSNEDLIQKVEGGFSYKTFEKLLDLLSASMMELGDLLQIPRRTLTRRKKSGRFPPDESERILRFSRVLDTAVELFEGDQAGAVIWLRAPNRALNGKTPLGMTKTEIGAREVENLIGRLEYGVFS